MEQNQLDSYNGISIGDKVEVFDEDRKSKGVGLVEKISLLQWTPEECGRLSVPDEERFIFLSNGITCGSYERCRKVE